MVCTSVRAACVHACACIVLLLKELVQIPSGKN